MKILLATHYAPPHMGGIEYIAWEQARRFGSLGHQVSWITSQLPTPDSWPTSAGVQIVRHRAVNPLESSGIPYPLFSPGLSKRFLELAHDADVIHTYGALYQTTSAATRIADLLGKPLVLSCQVIDRARQSEGRNPNLRQRAKSSVIRAMETGAHRLIGRRNINRADAIVICNPQVGLKLRPFLRRRPIPLHYIANGVDTRMFAPASQAEKVRLRGALRLPANKKVICFIGRPVPRKGLHLLLKGCPREHHVLVIGGDTPPLALESASASVSWLPTQKRQDIPDLLKASDLFALPSVGEGLPLCALEAMASALPVVLTDDPGYREVLGECAVTYVSANAQSIHKGIAETLSNPDRMKEQGRQGRELVVKSFSWDENVRRHLELYKSVIQRNRWNA